MDLKICKICCFVHSYFQVIGHAALANILWHHAKHTDLKSKPAISGFYMFIWKVQKSITLFSIYPRWFACLFCFHTNIFLWMDDPALHEKPVTNSYWTWKVNKMSYSLQMHLWLGQSSRVRTQTQVMNESSTSVCFDVLLYHTLFASGSVANNACKETHLRAIRSVPVL